MARFSRSDRDRLCRLVLVTPVTGKGFSMIRKLINTPPLPGCPAIYMRPPSVRYLNRSPLNNGAPRRREAETAPVDAANLSLWGQSMGFPDRVVRIREVADITGLSTVWIYKLQRAGDFPRSFEIVPNGRDRGWRLSTVMSWLEQREATGRTPMRGAAA